jgi:CrcB protein
MIKILSLALGGIAGTLARYFLSHSVHRTFGNHFPYGALLVNLIGCFAIGFLAAAPDEKLFLGAHSKIFLIAGFCGAFTTFSTLILETSELAKDTSSWHALANILVSVILGFFVFKMGSLASARIYQTFQ